MALLAPHRTESTVVIPYRPRPAFLPYHKATERFALSVAHRRAGKTVARINKLVKAAATCQKEDPRFGYLAPFYVQAKDIAWNYLKKYSAPILQQYGPFKARQNESELFVQFPHNNAIIKLYGADNIDRMRGLYFDGLAVDEAQDITSSALTSVILPALADRSGWLDMSGTPKGWGNLLGKTYKMAVDDMDWFVQLLRASKTGILPASELAQLRKLMPENEYEQEFECSFDAAITGAYYAKGLKKAEEEGRIGRVPFDKAAKVHTWWDLGISDSMTIWFVQLVGREIRVINYYEASGHGLEHYTAKLWELKGLFGYQYGQHWGPHDIRVRELGTGRSRIETASGLGVEFDVAPNLPVMDGINGVRMVLDRCWFDKEKTGLGLDALKQYQEKLDKDRNVSLGPLHNWCSHAADSFRIGVVALEEKVIRQRMEETETHGYVDSGGAWMS